jgi:hypothetical protein
VSAAADPRAARGGAGSHLGRPRLLMLFGGGLTALLLIAIVILALLTPAATKAVCPPGEKVCGKPPRAPKLAPRLQNDAEYTSPALGFRFEYPAQLLEVTNRGATKVELRLKPRYGDDLSFVVEGANAAGTSPSTLASKRLDDVSRTILGLTADSDPANAVLGPEVGYRSGVGGVYAGAADSPSGVGGQLRVVVMAASDGRTTLAVSVATSSLSEDRRRAVLDEVNSILNTLRFSSDIVARSRGGAELASTRAPGARSAGSQ